MGIDVAMITERQEVIQQVFDPRQHLTSMALGAWRQMTSGCCVRFIDPFGDTVFNEAQLPELLSELELSRTLSSDPQISDHLTKICNLVRQAQRKGSHIYVKFIGD